MTFFVTLTRMARQRNNPLDCAGVVRLMIDGGAGLASVKLFGARLLAFLGRNRRGSLFAVLILVGGIMSFW